jgi:hypothetical protein
MVGLSNIVPCRITAPAHALGGWRVASLGSGGEFGGVFRVVLASLYAEFASAVAGLAAIHAEAAGVKFFCAGSDVFAVHETVKLPYVPSGLFCGPVFAIGPLGVFSIHLQLSEIGEEKEGVAAVPMSLKT